MPPPQLGNARAREGRAMPGVGMTCLHSKSCEAFSSESSALAASPLRSVVG